MKLLIIALDTDREVAPKALGLAGFAGKLAAFECIDADDPAEEILEAAARCVGGLSARLAQNQGRAWPEEPSPPEPRG